MSPAFAKLRSSILYLFKWRRLVEFAETDMVGIVHFANYFRYMEMAEHAMFRHLGRSIHQANEDGLRWPRVQVACDYKKPLTFEDEMDVYIYVKKLSRRTIEYLIPLKRVTHTGSELVAVGKMTVVCCRICPELGSMKAMAIPDDLAELLQPANPASYAAYL